MQINLVPPAGLEPALPKKLDFESSASTNSATEAHIKRGLQAVHACVYAFVNDFVYAFNAPAIALCSRECKGSLPAMICLSQIASERPR